LLVDADIASHTWHTLAVRAKDDEFVISLDGTWMFTVFDPRRAASRFGPKATASRDSIRSKSRRCHESVMTAIGRTPHSTVNTRRLP
jgi:hypothetical protein